MRLLVALLAAAAAIIEVAVAPLLAPGTSAAVLPLALIAAWGVVRGADEVMLALPAAAIPLGVMSEERVGWFIVAALPLLVALLLINRGEAFARAAGIAAAVASAGSIVFGLVLLLVGGRVRAVPHEAVPLLLAACAAALLASIAAGVLWRWRTQSRRLFA